MFDFFGLPRELRDYIFDALEPVDKKFGSESKHGEGPESQLSCIAQSLPQSNFLIVGRQFGYEYHQRVLRRTRLVIEDHLHCVGDCLKPKLPKEVLGIPRIHFDILVSSETMAGTCSDIHDHRIRIDHAVAQLRPGCKITVRVHIEKRSDQMVRRIRTLTIKQRYLIDVGGLEWFEVSYAQFSGVVERWNYQQPFPLLMRWHAAEGLQICAVP